MSNPDFLLGGRTSASAKCRHWSGRAVRWSSGAIVQAVDQRMRLGMRCRLSLTADVPSRTSGAAMHSAFELGLLIAELYQHIRSVPDQTHAVKERACPHRLVATKVTHKSKLRGKSALRILP